jgi:hypothetical protein
MYIEGIVSIANISRPLKQDVNSVLDEISKKEPESPIRLESSQSMPQWMFA